MLRSPVSQTEHVHRSVDYLLGISLQTIKEKRCLGTAHSGFLFLQRGVNMNASALCLLTFPSLLFPRLRAVLGLSELLPGLV